MVLPEFEFTIVMPTEVGIHCKLENTIFGFSPSRVFDPLLREWQIEVLGMNQFLSSGFTLLNIILDNVGYEFTKRRRQRRVENGGVYYAKFFCIFLDFIPRSK